MNQAQAIETFIRAANAFDVETVLSLFAEDAVIEDQSVGATFAGSAGVRRYLDRYFVGYHTKTTLLALEDKGPAGTKARVDFVGDFGHETGSLQFAFDSLGLIRAVEAHLD